MSKFHPQIQRTEAIAIALQSAACHKRKI